MICAHKNIVTVNIGSSYCSLRYLLRAVICHHHAEHQPTQPQRQRQAPCGALYLHEQRHQWRRRSARGTAQGRVFLCNECVRVCVCVCVCDEWSLGPFCHTCSIRKRHFLHCLPVWLIVYLLPPPAEPLRQHQKRAFQNPRGRWQWSDAHVLQPWQRRLAPKARYVHSGDTHTQKEETLIMLIFVRRHSTSDWGAVSFISLFVCVCLLVYDGLSAAMLEVDSSWGIKWLKIADCTT